LRAFEAVARHGHVGRAADELHVTSSAVSHQLRVLEDYLRVTLFDRQNRRMQLTPIGSAYLASVREAFDLIADASRVTQYANLKGTLTVCLPPGLASKWLARRMGRFLRAHPEITLSILPERDPDLRNEELADVLILYGDGNWPKRWVRELSALDFFPVCSPKLLNSLPPLRAPQDLLQCLILHDDDGTEWRRWFEANGVKSPVPQAETYLFHGGLTLDTALAGAGIALGDALLAAEDLNSGQLVRLFDMATPARGAYHVVCTRERIKMPKIRAFVTWLFEERGLPAPALDD
jgi:LysR family glycine cleavage system transcriptional activator